MSTIKFDRSQTKQLSSLWDLLETCFFQAPNLVLFCMLFSHTPHPLAKSIGSTFKISQEFGYFHSYHSGLSPTVFVWSRWLQQTLPPSASFLVCPPTTSSPAAEAVFLKLVPSLLKLLQMSRLITRNQSPSPYSGFPELTQSRPLAALLTSPHTPHLLCLGTLASAVPKHTGHTATSGSGHKLGNSSNSLYCFIILSLCLCHPSSTWPL